MSDVNNNILNLIKIYGTPRDVAIEFFVLDLNIKVIERFIEKGYSNEINMSVDEFNEFINQDQLNDFKLRYNKIKSHYMIKI